MDPNFGSIKMTLIFQKDCITCMDPKFGSIKMNLIVQICLKQRQVFCVKIWIHEKLPVPGSIKMNYNPHFLIDCFYCYYAIRKKLGRELKTDLKLHCWVYYWAEVQTLIKPTKVGLTWCQSDFPGKRKIKVLRVFAKYWEFSYFRRVTTL